jgi:3-hydroxyacyl-[acyl-carrier-protein] dehydratase
MTLTPERFEARVHIAVDHPSFAGHFPARPLLPGVVLIAEVLEAIRAEPTWQALVGKAPMIDMAKFTAPVEPGSDLVVTLARTVNASLDFSVTCRETLVAKGRLSAGPPP